LKFVEDRGELWDIWMRLWHAHGAPELPVVDPLLPGSLQECSGESQSLAREAMVCNARVASRLQTAMLTCQLDCGPRAWLAQVAIFHWNRWGLGPDSRVRILSAMHHLLDPHRVVS